MKRAGIFDITLITLFGMGGVALLSALATHLYTSRGNHSVNPTRASVSMIKQALNTFEVDHNRFPTTAEGLDILVHQPAGMDDWHPYLEKIPTDVWGRPFVYRQPSTTGAPFYDLYSVGPDGQDGTPDDVYEDR